MSKDKDGYCRCCGQRDCSCQEPCSEGSLHCIAHCNESNHAPAVPVDSPEAILEFLQQYAEIEIALCEQPCKAFLSGNDCQCTKEQKAARRAARGRA